MKLRVLVAGIALGVVTMFVGGQLFSQDPGGAKQPPKQEEKSKQQKEMEEMMAVWMKFAQPGEHHDHLKPLAGKWKTGTTWRMAPEAPTGESKGEAAFEWILGGRFLTQKVEGGTMEETGGPFEGFGILGYDNYKKKYVSIWMDNMGTMIMTAEGACDASGKVITFTGQYDDPMTNKKKTGRTVYRIEGPDRIVFEMYDQGPDGKEFKMLEVVYSRVK